MTPRPRSRPKSLADLVPRVLSDLGYDRANALARMADRWPAIVGDQAAAHCRPSALRGKVLQVDADSSGWCQQLHLRREEILAGLERELGAEAPTDLWLRVG